VTIPNVIGALGAWRQNTKKKKPGASGLPYYCSTPVPVPDVNKQQTNKQTTEC